MRGLASKSSQFGDIVPGTRLAFSRELFAFARDAKPRAAILERWGRSAVVCVLPVGSRRAASFSLARESKKSKENMAFVSPLPRLARTEAEPLLATIGNTPLVRLERIAADFPGIEIVAKAEYFNPGGSVKDRAAFSMVLDGERSGKLNHNRTILDSTSGNTGIAYAMIGANRGYPVKLVLPANASPERQRILKAYGAEMIFSDAAEGSDGAIRLCRRIYMADPDLYFYPDQYNNPANWKAHFEHTGP
jgi:threonine synthase